MAVFRIGNSREQVDLVTAQIVWFGMRCYRFCYGNCKSASFLLSSFFYFIFFRLFSFLVFWHQSSRRNSNRITPYGDDRCRWGGLKLATCWLVMSLISLSKLGELDHLSWVAVRASLLSRLLDILDLLQWLSELQCSEPGWLVRQGVGSSPTPASLSS